MFAMQFMQFARRYAYRAMNWSCELSESETDPTLLDSGLFGYLMLIDWLP